MAGLVNLTRQAPTYQGYRLSTPADMVTALDYLKEGGYTGTINLPDSGVWQMWLQHTQRGTSQSAVIGDWIVIENNTIARIVQQSNVAAEGYTVQ